MSLSKATFRQLANNSTAPVRAFSTNRVALQSVNPSNSRLSPQRTEEAPLTDRAFTLARDMINTKDNEKDAEHRKKSSFMTRLGKWKLGDIYAPHDLTGVETAKWRKRGVPTPTSDAFDSLALDPLKEYKNFSILSNYMSEYGRIKHRKLTGLRPKNQRKLAKAIRRSIGLGIMPSVHAHPESIWNTSRVATDKLF